MRRASGCLAAVLLVLLALACGGGEDEGGGQGSEAAQPTVAPATEGARPTAEPATQESRPTGGDELAQALRTLGQDDLALMVLPSEELGGEAAGLGIDEESGVVDNEEAADDTTDPGDTGDDLGRAGRIGGYQLLYSDAELSALTAGEGMIEVGTGVALFEDAESASAFIAKELADSERFEGEELGPGFTLATFETFRVDGIADEAVGTKGQANFADARFYGSFVVFRLDRIVGTAYLARADEADVSVRLQEIARALERRIEGVLLGDVTGPAPALPETDEEELETAAPLPGTPDLAAMALGLDDLPAGVSTEREGYVEDETTVASYHREFDPGTARIGSSALIVLESDVELFETAAQASLLLPALEEAAESEGAEFFGDAFAEGGSKPRDLRVEVVGAPEVGDAALAVHASYDTPLGRLEAYFFFFQVDQAVGILFASGQEGEVELADLVPLARAAGERMRTVLGSGSGPQGATEQAA